LPFALEVVRIRRLAEPPEPELLALALGLAAPLLFAADRPEEADAHVREALDAYRRAFGAHDLRMAQQLEWQAALVQKGFGRMQWAVELLREAVAIREADVASSRAKLAETLVELAIHEMNGCEFAECGAHLAAALGLLKAEIAARRGTEESRALLVQALVMRSGIAGKLANASDALRFAHEAKSIRFKDRATRVEMRLIILGALGTQLKLAGDVAGAIGAEKRILETIARNADLFESGRLDALIEGDSLLALAALHVEDDDLHAALSALERARAKLGDTREVLFAYAELARKSGYEGEALKWYRAALKLRKESAAEVEVLFGTNRVPLDGGEKGRFGSEMGTAVRMGSAAVLVPGAQFTETTKLRPTVVPPIPVGSATNAALLLIRAKRVCDEKAFVSRAGRLMLAARLNRQAALVFVHGFNVKFDQALQRGAQLARDLNFDGPLFVFSWASQGSELRYGTDRSSADASADSLVEFLGEVARASGAEQIHALAHSMGNRVLLPALAKVCRDAGSGVRERLGEIVLAAPAVPERDFAAWIDDIAEHGGGRITLYASAVDRALQVGWFREWGTTLAGYVSGGVPLLHPHVQSIDITQAASGDTADLNHDVFASNPVMSEDIRQILQLGSHTEPDVRLPGLLTKCGSPGEQFWVYTPPRP
jgi:esterase/lipase superfamily enzyme